MDFDESGADRTARLSAFNRRYPRLNPSIIRPLRGLISNSSHFVRIEPENDENRPDFHDLIFPRDFSEMRGIQN